MPVPCSGRGGPPGRWGHAWVASARPTAARPGHPRAWPACCARAGAVAREYREWFRPQHSPLPFATQLAQEEAAGDRLHGPESTKHPHDTSQRSRRTPPTAPPGAAAPAQPPAPQVGFMSISNITWNLFTATRTWLCSSPGSPAPVSAVWRHGPGMSSVP